jgi:hypothetical protein
MTVRSPDRFTLGEMFCAPGETGFRACIVTNLLDEDGHYGDLVEVPGGERFAASRAALGREWQPMVCGGPWHVAQYSAHGNRADWQADVPSLDFVIALAKCARHRGQGEVIRYRSAEPISPQDLGRLRFLNVTRLP